MKEKTDADERAKPMNAAQLLAWITKRLREYAEADIITQEIIMDNILRDWLGVAEETDAHLIAAAPELLEALQNILADCEVAEERRTPADWDFACTQAMEYARAAIAKADGKS